MDRSPAPAMARDSSPATPGDAGTGVAGVPVSVQLTGLTPGATYRYRLVAVNALGEGLGSVACGTEGGQEADGGEALFTTPDTPPAPLVATGAASDVTQNAATIAASVDPRGIPTTYEFQLGEDTAYGVQIFADAGAATEPQPVSLTLHYLQPATTYHYRIVAISRGGTSYGADAALTTSAFPTAVLVAPATAPLLSVPAIAFPADATATTGVAKPKAKAHKKKAKKTGKKAKKADRHAKYSRTSDGGSRR